MDAKTPIVLLKSDDEPSVIGFKLPLLRHALIQRPKNLQAFSRACKPKLRPSTLIDVAPRLVRAGQDECLRLRSRRERREFARDALMAHRRILLFHDGKELQSTHRCMHR